MLPRVSPHFPGTWHLQVLTLPRILSFQNSLVCRRVSSHSLGLGGFVNFPNIPHCQCDGRRQAFSCVCWLSGCWAEAPSVRFHQHRLCREPGGSSSRHLELVPVLAFWTPYFSFFHFLVTNGNFKHLFQHFTMGFPLENRKPLPSPRFLFLCPRPLPTGMDFASHLPLTRALSSPLHSLFSNNF